MEIPTSKRRQRTKVQSFGKVAKVKVILVGDSKFRDRRIRPHLHLLNKKIRRSVLRAEYVKFEVHDEVLSFPGKSCKDRATSMKIRKRVEEVCRGDPEQLFLVIFSMGGNGVFSMVGVQSDREVEKELAAHKELLLDLLRQNRNLCLLALGVFPRPKIEGGSACLRRVNYELRRNMRTVGELMPGRMKFEEVGRMLRQNPNLFCRDGVHLTQFGTRAVMGHVSQLCAQAPLKFGASP